MTDTIHLRLKCPRCKRQKTIIVTWRTRFLQTIGKLPPDTRCTHCWRDGWRCVAMSVVSAKAYPTRSGRVASEQPLSAVIKLPAPAPTPGEAA